MSEEKIEFQFFGNTFIYIYILASQELSVDVANRSREDDGS